MRTSAKCYSLYLAACIGLMALEAPAWAQAEPTIQMIEKTKAPKPSDFPTATLSCATCPVLKMDGWTYWVFDVNNGKESSIVAFDSSGNTAAKWGSGAKWGTFPAGVTQIKLDAKAKRLTLVGKTEFGPLLLDDLKVPARWGTLKTSGKCLDALPAEVTKAEGRVRLMTCNGKDNQAWQFASGERIINKAGDLCLDAHRAQMDKPEGVVQLYPCHGHDNQTWRFDAAGHLQLNNVMCLDIKSNPPYPDEAKAEVFPCTAPGSQDVWTFTLEGPPSLHANMALALVKGDAGYTYRYQYKSRSPGQEVGFIVPPQRGASGPESLVLTPATPVLPTKLVLVAKEKTTGKEQTFTMEATHLEIGTRCEMVTTTHTVPISGVPMNASLRCDARKAQGALEKKDYSELEICIINKVNDNVPVGEYIGSFRVEAKEANDKPVVDSVMFDYRIIVH